MLATPLMPEGNPILEAKFWEFHKARPEVYSYICKFLQEAIDRGRSRFSISMVYERIRWYVEIELGTGEFKLPNNHRAYYARLWQREHPAHAHLIKICQPRSGGLGGPRDEYGREIDDDDDDE
jgi:hypothetical protein